MRHLLFLGLLFMVISAKAQNNDNNNSRQEPVYQVVEQQPQFPGGPQKFQEYLENNLQYPPEALKDSIEGKVYVSFVVNKDGSLSDFQIMKGVPELNEEAIRVVKNSLNWLPGKMNGKAVKVKVIVPIIFRLN